MLMSLIILGNYEEIANATSELRSCSNAKVEEESPSLSSLGVEGTIYLSTEHSRYSGGFNESTMPILRMPKRPLLHSQLTIFCALIPGFALPHKLLRNEVPGVRRDDQIVDEFDEYMQSQPLNIRCTSSSGPLLVTEAAYLGKFLLFHTHRQYYLMKDVVQGLIAYLCPSTTNYPTVRVVFAPS